VTLLDFSMPGMNGYEGLAAVRAASEGRPVAIMSGAAPAGAADRALEYGAAGFLPKTLAARSMVNAIRFMASGERYIPIDMLRGASGEAFSQPFDGRLSPRETQVLRALCEGKANKEIARDLNLREPTVKLHVKLLCRKLGARNRTHAAMLAKDAGFC
jgi:DNA-binding NarL/FixJ family response regulator